MKLEKIGEEIIAKNGSPYKCLTIDGKEYNYWEALGSDIKVGDLVDCEFEENGKYTNLISVMKAKVQGVIEETTLSKHDVILTRVEKPHSYEFGKAGARHKIYYDVVADLVAHISALREAGLLVLDETPDMPIAE